MRTVAVVPMKLNSQRLPGKNIKAFTNGKSLCWYILSTLLQVKGIQEVYVYCSSPEIQAYIPERVRYLPRGKDLDQDSTKMNQVLRRFAADVPADIYVMTHATAPFIRPESIQKGLDAVLSGAYDSALAVKELQDFLWKDGKPWNYQLDNIPRTQDLPPLYQETSGFYGTRKNRWSPGTEAANPGGGGCCPADSSRAFHPSTEIPAVTCPPGRSRKRRTATSPLPFEWIPAG